MNKDLSVDIKFTKHLVTIAMQLLKFESRWRRVPWSPANDSIGSDSSALLDWNFSEPSVWNTLSNCQRDPIVSTDTVKRYKKTSLFFTNLDGAKTH